MKKLLNLWVSLPDSVKRVVHTFWQTFVGALLISIAGVHDINTAKAALLAAVASALSAAKGLYTAPKQ